MKFRFYCLSFVSFSLLPLMGLDALICSAEPEPENNSATKVSPGHEKTSPTKFSAKHEKTSATKSRPGSAGVGRAASGEQLRCPAHLQSLHSPPPVSPASKVNQNPAEPRSSSLRAKVSATCLACVRRIERHLRQTSGVTSVAVNLEPSTEFIIAFDKKKISEKKILELMEKEGYSVAKLDVPGK